MIFNEATDNCGDLQNREATGMFNEWNTIWYILINIIVDARIVSKVILD